MEILALLLPLALLLSGFFLFLFLKANQHDQWEDLETPAHRILFEEKQDEK